MCDLQNFEVLHGSELSICFHPCLSVHLSVQGGSSFDHCMVSIQQIDTYCCLCAFIEHAVLSLQDICILYLQNCTTFLKI